MTSNDGVLVRFGEIGIKSAPVRRRMLERLRQNLLDAMVRRGLEGDVQAVGARLWMVGPDAAALADAAAHTFGVVSVSPARQVPATMEALGKAAAELALAQPPWTRFAIRATREGKHPFSSQDIGVQAGSAVFKAAEAAGRKPKVDLTKPELEVFVDVRQDRAFVFRAHIDGPGGIPVGTQGTVLALVSDEASLMAAWLMMRRGCRVVPAHAGDAPDAKALAALQAWGLPVVKPLYADGPGKPALFAAASRLATARKALAIVTGEGLRSPFLPADRPVLRPLCGLDGEEVARLRRVIGLE